jgi:DNA-binding MarR family transcriptional regulator
MSTKPRAGSEQASHQKSELIERWIRIVNKIIKSESLPRDFGTGDPLFMSEVHTLCAIGAIPGINITDLSVRLGVTKGAISKIAKKMEEKELIERYQEPGNDKEVLLRLTPKGKKAYLGHEKYHEKAFEQIMMKMDQLTDEQTAFVFQVFEAIEEIIDSTPLEKDSVAKNRGNSGE